MHDYPRPRPTTTILVGRDVELRRIEAALAIVPVAVVFGVAGVGKSTLALAFASTWPGPVAYVKLASEQSIAELFDAMHHKLGVRRFHGSLSVEERLEELWTAVEQLRCLAVIDDVHFLPPAVRDSLVRSATQHLHHARLVVVSRELIAVSADTPDRLQLRLETLDRAAAQVLWHRLIELYGPGPDFDAVWQRSQGNPFLIRQAIVGGLSDGYPLDSVVHALAPDELWLAGAAALSRAPLPRKVLAAVLPAPRAERALDTLVTRLVVDATIEGDFVVHDLFREAILRELDPRATLGIHRALATALDTAEVDVWIRVQETARHLRQIGDDTAIAAMLVRDSAELVRHGATQTLLRELDALPRASITPALVLLRSRTLARAMQIRRAYDELQRLLDRTVATPLIRMFHATFATICGELDDAQPAFEALLAEPGLDAELRMRAKLGLAWTLANRGSFAAARLALDDPELAALWPMSRALPLRLYLLALEDEHGPAVELAAEVVAQLRERPRDLWSRLVTPVICAVILAQAGRCDEADEAVVWMERNLVSPEDCLELGWTRVLVSCERGQRIGPLTYFQRVQHVLDRGGHFVGAVLTRAVTAKLLLVLGQRSAGLAVIEELRAQCRDHNTTAFERFIEAAVREDPLSPGWLAYEPAMASARRGDAIRVEAKAALRRACALPAASELRVELPPDTDYAFDRALVLLAQAVVARRHGKSRAAGQHVDRAIAAAVAGGADEGLIVQLLAALPVPGGSGARPGFPQDSREASGRTLFIDMAAHEIRCGDQSSPLLSRKMLRRLLYALIATPQGYLSRDDIARTLWNTDYDPLRHESSLKSNIRRLRALLADTGAVLESDQDGYRIVLPPDTVIISPSASS